MEGQKVFRVPVGQVLNEHGQYKVLERAEVILRRITGGANCR
jgi:hypothetical protein